MNRVLGVVAALMTVAACTTGPAPTVAGPVPVTVTTVASADVGEGHTYSGVFRANRSVVVRAQAGGEVTALHASQTGGGARAFQSGDAVTTADHLVQIDRDVYLERIGEAEAQKSAAHAAAQRAIADFDRISELFRHDSASQAAFDAAQAAKDAAVAQAGLARHTLGEARLQLAHTRVAPPFDAVVVHRFVELGDVVSAGTPLFEVADTARMKLVIAVPSTNLGRLPLGMMVPFELESLPGEPYVGEVSRVAVAADARTRLFDVELSVANPEGLIHVGMVAVASMPGARGDAASAPEDLRVPLRAIVRPTGQSEGFAVFTVERTGADSPSGVARLQEVEVGAAVGDHVLVEGGLDADAEVVLRGATRLRDGDPVTVLP